MGNPIVSELEKWLSRKVNRPSRVVRSNGELEVAKRESKVMAIFIGDVGGDSFKRYIRTAQSMMNEDDIFFYHVSLKHSHKDLLAGLGLTEGDRDLIKTFIVRVWLPFNKRSDFKGDEKGYFHEGHLRNYLVYQAFGRGIAAIEDDTRLPALNNAKAIKVFKYQRPCLFLFTSPHVNETKEEKVISSVVDDIS